MKKYFYLLVSLFITSLYLTSCNSNSNLKTNDKPENIILLIGDGMSTPQVYAAMLTQDSPTVFEQFPVSGLVKTHSKSHKITDSAKMTRHRFIFDLRMTCTGGIMEKSWFGGSHHVH